MRVSTVDLHSHTHFSDGELSPEELVDLAAARGVRFLALTDHEALAGIARAQARARQRGVELVPGIEINCHEWEHGFADVHVVGLFLDPDNRQLAAFCERVKRQRIAQKREMIRKLQKLGFAITFEEVAALAGYSIGRPHIAQVLMRRYPQRFPTTRSVFEAYIGRGKPAYADREERVAIRDAVRLIRGAHGIAVLAHPGISSPEGSEKLVQLFAAAGGQAVETRYAYDLINGLSATQSRKLNHRFGKLAAKHGLLESGGSDFHGSIRKMIQLGSTAVPVTFVRRMKEALGLR